jgi:hypothetical protein
MTVLILTFGRDFSGNIDGGPIFFFKFSVEPQLLLHQYTVMEGDLTTKSTTLLHSFEISLPSQLFFYVLATLDFSSPDYDELMT